MTQSPAFNLTDSGGWKGNRFELHWARFMKMALADTRNDYFIQMLPQTQQWTKTTVKFYSSYGFDYEMSKQYSSMVS